MTEKNQNQKNKKYFGDLIIGEHFYLTDRLYKKVYEDLAMITGTNIIDDPCKIGEICFIPDLMEVLVIKT